MSKKKKIEVVLKVKLLLNIDKNAEVDEVINELDYNFTDTTGTAVVYDSTIEDFEVRN